VLALAGLAVVVAAGAVALWPRPNLITKENCDRIHVGMTRIEVLAILGPPEDRTTGPVIDSCGQRIDFADRIDTSAPNSGVWWWATDDWEADAYFDDFDRVSATHSLPNTRVPQGSLAALLWRAKRRWFPE
jgi:hypothetical protein